MDKVARKLDCFGVCQSQKFGNKTQSKQNSQLRLLLIDRGENTSDTSHDRL